MAMTDAPPTDLEEFLHWFGPRMERYWSQCDEATLAQQSATGVGGVYWRRGTKWKPGLSSSEIDALEASFGVSFPDEYRLFLSVLNTPDQGMIRFNYKEPGDRLAQGSDAYRFPDWVAQPEHVKKQLDGPLRGWLFDIEHGSGWFDFLGPEPQTLEEKKQVVVARVSSEPRLIPVFGHRYMGENGCILSVHQTDVVPYGANLRDYLLDEFCGLLGEVRLPITKVGYKRAMEIPLWGELVA